MFRLGRHDAEFHPSGNASVAYRADNPKTSLFGCQPAIAFANASSEADSFHSGDVHALFADGDVEFLSNSIAVKVWRALENKANSEV